LEATLLISFQKITDAVARAAASKWAVLGSFASVGIWAAFGPYFGWSDAHQLFINTATTIVTYWLGFLILAAQYRGDKALSVKIDELIRSNTQARNKLIALEEKTEDEIEAAADEIKTAVEENGQNGA
jgi:low affinity Fe/Cu permease